MGWAPKDQWRGDPEKWIDADAFVERGEQLLPFVRADNRRLKEQLTSQARELSSLKDQITALTEFNADMAKERLKAKRTEIAQGIKDARENNDVEAELELKDELDELNDKLKTTPTAKKAPATEEPNPAQSPEFQDWMRGNPWFNQDQRRTDYAMAVAARLRNSGKFGKDLLDEVSREVAEVFGQNPRRAVGSKVEGHVQSGTPAGGEPRGKGYGDLPEDARAICDRQGPRFIGKGKAFPDVKAWRSHYCKQYFG